MASLVCSLYSTCEIGFVQEVFTGFMGGLGVWEDLMFTSIVEERG